MGMYESAALGLFATGHVSVQILAAISWARAMGQSVSSDVYLAPVREVMDVEPTHVLKMETLIAQGRFFSITSKQRNRAHVQRIVTHLNTIATQLNATDRAALATSMVQLRFAVQ